MKRDFNLNNMLMDNRYENDGLCESSGIGEFFPSGWYKGLMSFFFFEK